MSPRFEKTLHSLVAVLLLVAVAGAAIGLGYWLADLQGLRGKRLDDWMLRASIAGMVAGLLAFFAYAIRVMPRRLREPPPAGPSPESVAAHEKAIAAVEAREEALRQQLRATPGLERYAELVGRSTIGSVEDAREREARVAQLRADPVKAKYAERVFRGEGITDRMIAYWEDPAARVLCAHLAALEGDVRKADPHAAPADDHTLDARLTFDFDAVKRRYSLGPPVTFWRRPFGPEFHGRGEDNYDGAERIECTEHHCVLLGWASWHPFPPRAASK